jgi:acid stress chaperone HdeB
MEIDHEPRGHEYNQCNNFYHVACGTSWPCTSHIEVSKITCEQYLSFSVADPKDINIWLSGYYHGKQGSTVFEPQRLKEIAEKVKSECFIKENAKLPVLQVVEKVLTASKQ